MFVHQQSRKLLFNAPEPGVILGSMPAIEVPGNGFNVAAKHTEAATLALRGMGFEAPSPIVSYYKWPGKFRPFEHQRAMAEFMTMHKRCFNLSEMGTAKTNAVLWAADWMMSQGAMGKCVITSPLSTLERVWLVSIFETLMHRKAVIVHGSREKRMAALAQDVDFYIINHDGLKITPVFEELKKRKDITHFVVDEGSKFRNAKTDIFRCLEIILKRPDLGLWWLTGTPCPNGPDDSWAQCRLVNPDRVPKFYGAFRNRVMMEVSEHIWKPRLGSAEVVWEAMQPAIRFAKKDCLDLPPVVTENWSCDMSAEQTKAFKEMAQSMRLEDEAERRKGRTVTAVNAADKINKLRQIMMGVVKTSDGTYRVLDYGPRLKVLQDAIKFASAKVIIICPFKGMIHALEKDISKTCTVGLMNGDVSAGKRNHIVEQFKNTADPHGLLCHPTVMSHGLNLTEADLLVFFGPIYSNDEYRQVVERFNRPGQTRKMTIIRIGCNAIEWQIYKMLDTRDGTQSQILDLYNNILEAA